MSFTTDSIRNVAIAGHGGTGKTSLVEHILQAAGAISKAESVDSGKTISDYTDEEIERKISIHTSLTHISWKDKKINLLDTPGSSDFIGEVIGAFRTCESVILAVGAKVGVQIETIKLWRRLETLDKSRIIFVNKLDRERADYTQVIEDLKTKFKMNFVPVTLPMGSGEDYKGIIDLISSKAYLIPEAGKKEAASDIPSEYQSQVEEYRTALIEAAAEGDDTLMEKYLEELTLSDEEIITGLKGSLKANKCVPVLCGSAEKDNGIANLLNFLADIAPSPYLHKEKAITEKNEEIELEIDPEKGPSGFIFKTSIDQFSGRLSFIKVITGKIAPDTEVFNPQEGKKEKVSKLYTSQGKKLEEASQLSAGDIGIVAKMDTLHTNTSLCSTDNIFKFLPLELPQPVHAVAIQAASKKDEDKMNQFIQKATEEDLTFQVKYNTETKETVISGMGELHISIILDKIRDKQKIEMETRVPKVAYRESITKSASAEYTHKKQSGGHGQYGKVVIDITPLERGQYYKFENAIKGMAVSKGYVPGIEKGLHDAMEGGVLADYPVVDVGITLMDGKEHPVDSSEMSFRLAAKGALKAAMEKAAPVLLEPIMNLKVFVSEQYVGDVLSDLNSRRGRVLGQESLGGEITVVDAQVPQAELLRYSIDLRSITSGTASFEMEFDHYSPISGRIAEAVIQAAKAEAE